MNFPDQLLPQVWLWTADGLYAALLGFASWRAPWKKLLKPSMQHVYFGTCVGLLLLWGLRAGVTPGMGFHLLGATLLTLMFGWPLAIIAISLVLLGAVLDGSAGWHAYALNMLVFGALPVLVSHALYRAVDRWLPNHFFVYIFLCAFLGGALAMTVSGLGAVVVLVGSGTYPFAKLAREYLPFFPLMIFPEALLNGMLMTMLVGLRPQWVVTFDDERYLRPR